MAVATLLVAALGCGAGSAAGLHAQSSSNAAGSGQGQAASVLPGQRPGAATPAGAFTYLGVEVGGETIRVDNGQRLALGGDLFAEVTVVPFPPGSRTELRLVLLKGTTPVQDAKVKVTYDMVEMEHGAQDKKLGRDLGGGRYSIPLDLFMMGDWVAEVVVSHPQFDASFQLLLGAYSRK